MPELSKPLREQVEIIALMLLYSFAIGTVLVLGLPYWLIRMAGSGKYREGLPERLGRVPRRVTEALNSKAATGQGNTGQTVWVHAVSVGEVIAVQRLVERLAQELPEFTVVLSTTTRTGQQLARSRLGAERVFYFPLDLGWIVRRYLRALRPALIVLAETELWPNLLVEAERAGIPVVVVNARISDRSWPRYRALRALWRPLLARVTRFLAQSQLDAERLRAIGASPSRVAVSGNLKFDVRPAAAPELIASLRHYTPPGMRWVVAGSTLEGEEAALLDAWPELLEQDGQLALVLAPRHPERFRDVRELLDALNLPWMARSAWMEHPHQIQPGSVLLLDSIGELAAVYQLAAVAFVGGSLGPGGGHNPLEPAQFGVPVVIGPGYENFRSVVEAMRQADGIRICCLESNNLPSNNLRQPSRLGLSSMLGALLRDTKAAQEIGFKGRQVFMGHAGTVERTVADLVAIVSSRRSSSDADFRDRGGLA